MPELTRSAYDDEAPAATTRRGDLSGAKDVGWILGYFVVAGVVAAVVWWQVVDPPFFIRTRTGGVMEQAQLSRRVQADGWFLTIGVTAGLLGGVLLTLWRATRPLLVVLVGFVASLGGGVIALQLGKLLGHRDVQALLKAAKVGAHIHDKLDVISPMVLAAWPTGFLIGCVVILWGTTGRHSRVQAPDEQASGTRIGGR
jgi:hypothetical protein